MDLQSEKRLSALEQQLAELTRRIYHIEQTLAHGPSSEVAAAERVTELGPDAQLPVSLPGLGSPPVSEVAKEQDYPPVGTSVPAAFPVAALPSQPRTPLDRFAENMNVPPSRSLESVVGGQWLNRLGILAVLVGVSYFLKLAFENDWIGPGARILIGLLCGIGLLVWSERFRSQGFAVFAYSLKAIGLGTLYLSLWASSQFYHLVPPVAAFAGMVAVTLTSATLALLQDSELLAAGALVGGFLTPILISSNQNQEVALFSYLLLLDLGAFGIVWVKRWPRLLTGAFTGTALLSAGWASAYYNEGELATTLTFGTLFFLLFAMAPFVERGEAALQSRRRNMQAILIVANAIAYFGILFLMLWNNHRELLAWLLFAVAAFYYGLRRLLERQGRSSIGLDPLLFGLVVGFFTVGIPVALDGRWITFAWNAEAAVILWLAHHTQGRLLRSAGGIVLGLAVVRLITDGNTEPLPIFNTRFGLYLLTIAVTALLVWVSLQLDPEGSRLWAGAAVILINLLALGALGLELRDYFFQVVRATPNPQLQAIHIEEAFSYSALWIIYGAALITVGFVKREAFLRWQAIVLLCAAALKVFFFDIATLERGYRIAAFIALGIVLLAVSFSYQRIRASEARQ